MPTFPANSYDVALRKNDENDIFDEAALLEKVPKSQLKKAKSLLEVFDSHPEEVTWNSSGVIFIDDVSIPNSNINEIFPLLYERKIQSNDNVNGLDELILKIELMGKSDLICRKIKNIVTAEDISSDDSETNPWYYIGH